MRTREVVGREAELARLTAFVDRVAAAGVCMVLEGAPGIGKTELFRRTVALARECGCRVLETRSTEAESELSFAGLADLLWSVREEIEALLGPQRRSLSVALLIEEAGASPPDQRTIAAATLEVLRRLARSGPVLVAIDDVQWLDGSSAAALAFALRRAATEPVSVLLARRSGQTGSLELDRDSGVEVIGVGPLSLGAIRRVLQQELDTALPHPTLRRIHDRSGGNPFFAIELARALAPRDGGASFSEGQPLPDDLRRLVRRRLSSLPSETTEPLAAVAALGEPRFALVASEELDPAFAAGVLALEGERVRFTHPLLAEAAYEELAPQRRRGLHRRLATLVDDPEQRARHLALSTDGPDPALAALLEEAASHAHARGAPQAAAELAERALQFDDGASEAELVRRTAAAAHYHMLANDYPRARELLDRGLEQTPHGPTRARILHALTFCIEEVDVAIAGLESALVEASGDPSLEAEILSTLAVYVTSKRALSDGERHAREAVSRAERSGDPVLLASALSILAVNQFQLGHGLASETADRALALDPECKALRICDHPITHFGWSYLWTGDLDRSRALLEEACRIGEEQGDSSVDAPMTYRSLLAWLAESWREGLALADRLIDEMLDLERQDALLYATGIRAILLAHLGEEAAARRDVAASLALDESSGGRHGVGVGAVAIGVLELALDRPMDALPAARQATEVADERHLGEPALRAHFPIHVEAAIAVGELGEAEEVLASVEERALALDREWALACAARCRGLLAAAQGDEAGAAAAFERALVEHARVEGRRFDLARTLLAQGETLRRFKRKRAGREAIEAAIAIFDGLGAALWSAKARRELARISGRRSATGLTETERRIAELVAEGRSNKEVASELHVTVRTVESNLTKVYAKLGVRSRTELARRLSP